jgi:hypothetical protein
MKVLHEAFLYLHFRFELFFGDRILAQIGIQNVGEIDRMFLLRAKKKESESLIICKYLMAFFAHCQEKNRDRSSEHVVVTLPKNSSA